MPQIRPLRGIFYNPRHVPIDDVVAPPYDVISPEEQDALYRKNPYNVIRLIVGRGENRYTIAAEYFRNWLSGLVIYSFDEAGLL